LIIFEHFNFVQAVECVSEEILYYHSKALKVTGDLIGSAKFLKKAYQEMMRKLSLIPKDSPYCYTYLENIELHREIKTDYEAMINYREKKNRRRAITPPQ